MADNEKNKVTAAGTDAVSFGSLIGRTAALTVLCFLAAVSLVASLIGCFFPKAYMDMYRSVGAYGIASVYAEEALDRASHADDCLKTDCAYIRLVTSGVDVTSIAFDDKTDSAHAERLLRFTDAYLSASCHVLHSEDMDAYYADVYKDKSDAATLAAVYGYDGYVRGRQTAALCVLADESEYADRLVEIVSGGIKAVTAPDGNDDVYAAFDILTACARYSPALVARVEILRGAVDNWNVALGGLEEVNFDAVRLGYKLYRFASAMENADGDDEFEKNWNKGLVSLTYEGYNKLIKKYTTQSV